MSCGFARVNEFLTIWWIVLKMDQRICSCVSSSVSIHSKQRLLETRLTAVVNVVCQCDECSSLKFIQLFAFLVELKIHIGRVHT